MADETQGMTPDPDAPRPQGSEPVQGHGVPAPRRYGPQTGHDPRSPGGRAPAGASHAGEVPPGVPGPAADPAGRNPFAPPQHGAPASAYGANGYGPTGYGTPTYGPAGSAPFTPNPAVPGAQTARPWYRSTGCLIAGIAVLCLVLLGGCTAAMIAGFSHMMERSTPTSVPHSSPTTQAVAPVDPGSATAPTPSTGSSPSTGVLSDDRQAALERAQEHVDYGSGSKKQIYRILTEPAIDPHFTPAAAQYAVDHVTADWNVNALKSARIYLKMGLSRDRIREQLTSRYGNEFTPAEADYALAHL